MMTNCVFFVQFLVFYTVFCISNVFGQGPIVNTQFGQVRGVAADDGDYNMFLGIPFGKVNEDNPFGEALPPPPFESIFEANDDSAICPQREEFNHTIVGTVDCLYLNIHVPNTATPTNLRPVFVWIYGGGFQIGFFGRFLYGPKFLVRHDIVFVTINYRVGPYGFMCLDIPEVPGNQGLKDQVMALRWLRENIADFGGDPNKITIAGNSAGAMSADYLIMRENDGPPLFHQAIIQSGTSFVPFSSEVPRDAPLQLARHLGYETSDLYEAIAFLSNVDPLVIIEASFDISLTNGICVEKRFDGVEPFITQDFTTITEIPAVKNTPIMIGFMKDEAVSSFYGELDEFVQFIVNIYMSIVFDPQHPDFNFLVENTQQFYFGDEILNEEQRRELIDFTGDLMFIYPTHRSMKRFLDNDVEKMYYFQFSYSGGRNFVKHRENITAEGAAHADELGYLFDISYMDEPNAEDQRVIDSMTAMWANFVKYGDPTPSTSELLPYKWEAITKGSPYHYMDIDLQLRVGTRPIRERMTFWELLFETYESSSQTIRNSTNELYRLMKKVMLYK